MAGPSGARAARRPAPPAGRRRPRPERPGEGRDDQDAARQALRREAGRADRARQAAYQAGRRRRQRPDSPDPAVEQAYQAGLEEAAYQEGRTSRLPAAASRPSSSTSQVSERGAGLLLGLVTYALVLSYLRYGPAGPKSWIAAKFWNKPTLTAPAGPPSQKPPSSGNTLGPRTVF